MTKYVINKSMKSKTKVSKLAVFLVTATEWYLTRRARKKYLQQQKKDTKYRDLPFLKGVTARINDAAKLLTTSPPLFFKAFLKKLKDFALTLLWAIAWVFIINQFLIQAYVIPSGSMIPSLLVGDYIFVNKLVYGPEILPEIGKLPSPFRPERSDIVIFESPQQYSAGTAAKIAQRLIYMLTLSRVDINPEIQLLIKRTIGSDGDQIIFRNGNAYIKPRGESRFISEHDFIHLKRLNYSPRRLLPESDYELSRNLIIAYTYRSQNIALPSHLAHLEAGEPFPSNNLHLDRIRYMSAILEQQQLLYQFYPWLSHERANFYRQYLGIYVPDGYILPLGDNRDDSLDGRSWGVISQNSVLGKTLIRFWRTGWLNEWWQSNPLTFGIIR